MTLEKLYYYISLAVARNVIVFDYEAPNRITKRLLFLLCDCFKRNCHSSPTKIYVPEGESIEVYDILQNEDKTIELTNLTKVFGADIITTEYLNRDREGVKFYKNVCDGWLSSSDIGIIMATDDKDHIILGKY